jgi:hypothetical protein
MSPVWLASMSASFPEHPIGVIKRVFGFVKVRYRGLSKNTHCLVVTWRSPICLWRVGIYCAAVRHNLSDPSTDGCRYCKRYTNNDTAPPYCRWLLQFQWRAFSRQLLVQTFLKFPGQIHRVA